MKIHVVYDVKGWAYYSVAIALAKYAPPDMKITHSNNFPRNLETYDLVVVLPFPKMNKVSAQCKFYGVKSIIACYIQLPFQIDLFSESVKNADHIIFNNWISYKYWQSIGHDMSNVSYIPQGIDSDLFFDEKRPGRKDLALLCSSEHFQILKGVEIAKKCALVETHVANSFNPRLNYADMRALYNQYKVYVCLSECEGTPTPALEAAHCGCVVVTVPVGNMPELIEHGFNGFFLSNRSPDLVDHLVWNACYNYESMSHNMLDSISTWSWRIRANGFYDLFRKVATNPDSVLNH